MKKLILLTSLFFVTPSYGQKMAQASGSGIALTTNGYIATNEHVIDGATKIEVDVFTNNLKKTYIAEIVRSDKENDLAIIKITDTHFKSFQNIPYVFKMSNINSGEKVFAMGYPQIDIQGTEVKVTDGLISSKTGFQNSNREFQTSVAIQPGNSGGPLFDNNGNLIGINNAKIPSGENISYAIKISYLNNLIDQINNFPKLPEINKLSQLPLTTKIKTLTDYVVLIRVEVPICDKDLPSQLIKNVTSAYTLTDLNKMFGFNGEKTVETSNTSVYKWQFCSNHMIDAIMVTLVNNKIQAITKSFCNTNYSYTLPEKINSNLKVNLNYKEVSEIFGTEGDLKVASFDFTSKVGGYVTCVLEWKTPDNTCYSLTFVSGKVISFTKFKCIGLN